MLYIIHYIIYYIYINNVNIFLQSKLFALNIVRKYVTDVILLLLLEISI